MISALKTEKKMVQKRVAKCVYWALIQSEYTITLEPAQLRQLQSFCGKIKDQTSQGASNADASLYKTTLDILRKLQEIEAAQ